MEIYWGAVPFVIIQIVMVALIIFFPALVTGGLDKVEKLDLEKAKQEMQQEYQQDQQQPGVPGALPAQPGASGIEAMPNPADEQKAEDEEQKKLDELFKPKK